MKKQLYRSLMELTKSPVQSWGIRTFARSRASRPLVRSFARVYNINMEEAKERVENFNTLQSLFIRELAPDVRPVCTSTSSIVSPVDGLLAETGQISQNAAFFIKGQMYDVRDLVGLPNTSRRYIGGTYMLFYLSPTDYHRIHSPVEGTVLKTWALGKHSSPVNPMGLALGDRVLAKNYRLLTEVRTPGDKHMCVVKIGALNVNSIHPDNSLKGEEIGKGEEMAYFSFGSSVILLFEEGMIQDPETDVRAVKQGQPIAEFKNG
ncbi:phosphatidylserine decarboxylase [Alteribacter lacisalsi]|uniref:phosphatidylserine decarboxylase n=1 Tax=Alteribacter lacisalsi TaxID=2045244 RepID=A0A2W0HC16_9BACI|nr:phosphatidylserine decarboxylase [Alteribacter lacisalsi]PYZ98727.1 phosphatidylserine decarboxylase [Alteribacter lacisalsi]